MKLTSTSRPADRKQSAKVTASQLWAGVRVEMLLCQRTEYNKEMGSKWVKTQLDSS